MEPNRSIYVCLGSVCRGHAAVLVFASGSPIDPRAPVVVLAALDRDGNLAHSLLALATVHVRATTLPLPSIFSHEFS